MSFWPNQPSSSYVLNPPSLLRISRSQYLNEPVCLVSNKDKEGQGLHLLLGMKLTGWIWISCSLLGWLKGSGLAQSKAVHTYSDNNTTPVP